MCVYIYVYICTYIYIHMNVSLLSCCMIIHICMDAYMLACSFGLSRYRQMFMAQGYHPQAPKQEGSNSKVRRPEDVLWRYLDVLASMVQAPLQ